MKPRTPAESSRPVRRPKTAIAPSRKIRFKLPYTEAKEVFIAGTFNDWHPAMFPMIESRSGGWHKDLMLPPGVHEYLFVADGRWIADPGNPQTTPNPFGGVNSVLEVPAPRGNAG